YLWFRDEAKLTHSQGEQSDELVGSWIDITARKQAELALREKDQLLQGILDNTSTLVIAKDYRTLDGQYILVNKSYAQKYHTTPENLLGKNVYDVLPQDVARRLDESDRLVFNSGQVNQDEEEICFDGKIHTLLANKFPLYDPEGTIYGMCILSTDITERKEIEANLRQSEERYRLLAQNLPRSIVMLYDQNLKFILTDGPELERAGYSRKMLEGHLLHEAMPPEFADFVEPYMRRALNGERYTAILPFEDQFYEYFYVPLPDSTGSISMAMILGMNVTERMRAEIELKQKRVDDLQFSQKLTALQQITNQLSQAESFDEISLKAIELGRTLLGFDRISVWFAGEQFGKLRGSFGVDEHGQTRDERASWIQLAEHQEGWHILTQKEPIAKLAGAPLYDHLGQVVGEGQSALAPLWDGDEVIGLISIDNLLTQTPITEQQLEILKLYAISLGHLFRRKRIEEALRQSEANLQEAQKIARIGNFELDIKTQAIRASDEIAHIFGIETDHEINLDYFKTFLRPEHFSSVSDSIDYTIMTGKASTMEYDITTTSGELKHIYSIGRLLQKEDGTTQSIFGIIQDITDRKRVEIALRESEMLYRALFEQSNDGVAIHDVATGITVAANQALADLLECEISDIVGTPVEKEILADELPDARTRWQQTLDEGYSPPYERRLVTHLGNIRNFEITTTVIYESENQ
ncbi:MAG TPA: PAS domain S-box protein, partial [Anaerolineales bacterium]|nr:PAS domain S-box protein [Anaerolineales bacterium]